MKLTTEAMYDIIIDTVVDYEPDAIDLLIAVNGFNEKTMHDILYYYTGHNDFYDYLDELDIGD